MSVTWLHVSDFHLRAGESYDRDTVVGALVKSVKRFRERGRAPDLLFATGDITQSGKSAEYETATAFFDALLEAAGLEKDRLFVVPGNHDVDRGRCRGLARTLESEDKSAEYFSPGEPLPHLERSQGAFVGWYNRYFDSIRAMPDDSTCGPVQQVVVDGMKVGILPINSALFAQGDDDHAKLWVGRRCLKEAVRRLEGDVRIALLHHPLEWLHDVEQANIKAELHQHVDVLLRGHLHQNDVEMVVSPSGGALHLAAGAAYQTRKWPNRALYGAFDGRCVTVFPIRYEDAPEEVWVVDPSLFPMEEGHERDFDLPRLAARGLSPGPVFAPNPPPPLFRSNIPSRGGRPFVGREELLAEIASAFSDTTKESVLVAHGLAGVGKSELAREYARRALERYPGGAFFVDASQGAPFVDIARIGGAVLGLDFAEGLRVQEQAVRTLMALRAQPTLLIFDNVTDMEAVKEYLPAVGTPCHVLMTSLLETWGPEWRTVQVPPLPHMAGLELVEGIAGREVAQAWGEALVAQAEGLPIQLCSAAAAVAYEVHRRRTPALPPLADAASRSFGFVYSLLPEDCHVLLHGAAFLNGQRLSRGVLAAQLRDALEWHDADFLRSLDAVMDFHVLEFSEGEQLRMHRLFGAFVRAQVPTSKEAGPVERLRLLQRTRAVEAARSFVEQPRRTDFATALLVFPLGPPEWDAGGAPLDIEGGEALGEALCVMGHFEEARPWFERAVAAKEKGDVHGRVDNERLGSSLHQVGTDQNATALK